MNTNSIEMETILLHTDLHDNNILQNYKRNKQVVLQT